MSAERADQKEEGHDPASAEQIQTQFSQAIESMNMEEKKVYLEAKKQVPHLVETETNPMQFITYCDGDVWKAAKRLCLYWTERKNVFLERAFLPMDLTGRGAMSDVDILCLNGGFPAMLPKTSTGQTVVLIDRRQLTAVATLSTKQRCLFYMVKKAAEDYPRAQTEGILCVNIHIMPKMMQVDRQYLKRGLHLTVNAFPIKLKTRLVCLIPKSKKFDVVQSLVASYIKTMKILGMKSDTILDVHIDHDQQNLASELIEGGLLREGIPECLGGTWTFEDAAAWCRNEAALEREAKAERERENRRKRKLAPSRVTAPIETPIRANLLSSSSRGRTQQEQKAANAIHSRRKRERRKREEESLHREHKQSVLENTRLKKEEQRLKALLERARLIVQPQVGKTLTECAESISSSVPNESANQKQSAIDNTQNVITQQKKPPQKQSSSQVSSSSKSESARKDNDHNESSDAGSKNSSISKEVVGMNIKTKGSACRSISNDDDLSIASGLTGSTSLLDGPMSLQLDDASINSSHWPIMSTQIDEQDQESVNSSSWPVMKTDLDEESVNSSYLQ